jgi:DNA-3-methyladenine glycosylase II
MTTSAAGVLARLEVARARLHAADPVIAGLIDRRPDYDPRHRLDGIPPMDLFGALVFQVTGQQLSVASRRRILDRIQEMFGGHLPSPAELLQADPARLRQTGLSGRKISTLRDLAERLTDGRLNVDALSALPDEQIIAELTQVPGIGPWTVQGALILALNREDVVLPGDLALRKAVRDAYQLDHLPTPAEVLAIADRWRPYRSLATLYLFRAGESTAAVNRSVPALDHAKLSRCTRKAARTSPGTETLHEGFARHGLRQDPRKLSAGVDAELFERLVQVPFDRARTDEQPRSDLLIRQPFTGEPRDLRLMGRQIVGRLDRPLADRFARRHQLAAGTLLKCLHAYRTEHLVGSAKLRAGVHAPALATQPFAVQQVCPGELGPQPRASEPLDRLTVEMLGVRALA